MRQREENVGFRQIIGHVKLVVDFWHKVLFSVSLLLPLSLSRSPSLAISTTSFPNKTPMRRASPELIEPLGYFIDVLVLLLFALYLGGARSLTSIPSLVDASPRVKIIYTVYVLITHMFRQKRDARMKRIYMTHS